ncbi:MAG TPA: hypothetical protein VEA99_00325 [Gemmatimonadaceae bacterium]|nr:hypothetical protein [Gemmatimonadaceae bacterium]
MTEGVLFAIVFVGFFVLRGIFATIVFYFILPDSDRCPMCDAPTLHIHSPVWRRTLPGLRPSWCPDCRWEGMLRRPEATTAAAPAVTRPSSGSPAQH